MLLDALFARIPSVRARLTLLTAVLCLLMSGLALAGMTLTARSNESLRTVYDDRVVPQQQIKAVADAYAVTMVDSTHKVRLGQLDAAAAPRQIEVAGELIRRQWSAYSQTYLVPEEKALVARVTPLMVEAERLRRALLAARFWPRWRRATTAPSPAWPASSSTSWSARSAISSTRWWRCSWTSPGTSTS